jgi:hypothetical protein
MHKSHQSMKPRNPFHKNAHPQAGFGWVGVVVVVLIIVISIGAYFFSSSESGFTRINDYMGRLNANSIYSKAGTIAQGISLLNAQGWDIDSINLIDTAAASTSRISLFDPLNGATSMPNTADSLLIERPSSIAATDWGRWAMYGDISTGAGTFLVPGVASTAAEWAILLPGIKNQACRATNADLWGSSQDAAIPVASSVSSTSVYASMQTTNRVAGTTIDLSSASPANSFDGQTGGCGQTSDGVNFIYLVVSAQ